MPVSDIRNHPVFQTQWYHTLELAPGVITNGRSFDNLAVARQILNGVDVAGQTTLDIGCMDGLITFLMERRGAARAVAYDRNAKPANLISNGDRFRFAREALGSPAGFLWDMPIAGIQAASEAIGIRTYDVVVFSGVLYHMFDPMAGIAMVRNLVRDGGIVVIETGATLDASLSMHANAMGRFYPSDDFWLPSVTTLEYWLRFFHLDPLDGAFLHHRVVDGLPVVRAALACRALPTYRATPSDDWMRTQDHGAFLADFREFLDWEALRSDRPPVPYSISATHRAFHPGTDVLDVFSTLTSNSSMQAGSRPDLLRLLLTDV